MRSFFLTETQPQAQGPCDVVAHGDGLERDALGMFKCMLLGQWHGLSDTQREQTLRVRIDFMVFIGFKTSAGELPESIISRLFHNRLAKAQGTHSLIEKSQLAA